MKIIVSALFEEIETMFAKEKLQRIQNPVFELYRMNFNGEDVIVGCCGIGKVNAASFTQFVINHFIVDEIITIGAAGSLNPSLKIGDVVVAKDFIYGDVDVTMFGYEFGQMAQMPHKYIANDVDLSKLQDPDITTIYGTIVTVDKFLNKYDANFDLLTSKDAVEMESCAIAQVAYKNSVNVTCFRVISDNSFYAHDTVSDYEKARIIVADNLYKILKKYI